MRITKAIPLFILVVAATSSSAFAETHCLPTERTALDCVLKNGKVASVCLSKDFTDTKGYIQYRFGKVGRPEFVYPATRVGTQLLFGVDRLHPYQAPDVFNLSFKNGAYLYSIAVYGVLDDDGGEESAGDISISKPDGAMTDLKCNYVQYDYGVMFDLSGFLQGSP